MIMRTDTLVEAQVLTPPDTQTMEAARRHIHTQAIALKLDFLPAMKEKMLPLQAAVHRADTLYREKLAAVSVQLNSVNLQPLDQKQHLIEADQRLTDKQKQQAISLLEGERSRLISTLTTVVRSSAQAIAESSDDVQQINLKLDGNRLQETLQGQIDTLTQRVATLESTMTVILEDRRLLDETIKALEKHNLADQFKDALPSAEELSLINMPSPELALVNAGIARLGKLLDQVSGALTYFDLTKERDRLRLRYNALLAESRTGTQDTKVLAGKLDELNGLASVDQSKTLWVQEARKVYQSLYSFLDTCLSPDQSSASISQHVEQLKTYVKSFYGIKRTL
ncbi:alpha-xenorhabdolysin family binary toxin subunit B [Pseudomonas syringae]|nr:alpha-xenorhabdolysin family binary toxin subunit B [Pseudomonas syringae]